MLKHLDNLHPKQLPWWTLSIGATVLLIHSAFPTLAPALQMDRDMIANGAFWQLISGHLTHWNNEHLWADLAVFTVIGMLIEKKSRKHFTLLLFLSSIIISLGVLIFNPEITTYRGLSGVDMALAAYWAFYSLRKAFKKKQRFETLLWSVGLAGILLKPLIEIALGRPIFVQDLGSDVVGMPIPHIVGALSGIVMVITTQRNGKNGIFQRNPHSVLRSPLESPASYGSTAYGATCKSSSTFSMKN